jgi:hypothetical protein
MILKKHPFTLIEAIIAAGLTILLLGILLFFYRQINALSQASEALQNKNFQLRYAEIRLANVLPHAIPEPTEYRDFHFFTTQNPYSLIFIFDREVDKDRKYSSHILARLYVDSENKFCLGLWPAPNRWVEGITPVMKKEVLLEGVESIKFAFFVAPEKNWHLDSKTAPKETSDVTYIPEEETSEKKNPHSSDPLKPGPEGEWIYNWEPSYRSLPAIIKLEVVFKHGAAPATFAFPLVNSQRKVVFNQ